MKTGVTNVVMAVAALVLALSPQSAAIAGERPGDAALGALSGAVVLGPIGAVAGAVVGYSAGPSIAHSLGFRRSTARQRSAPRTARAAAGNRQMASGTQAVVPAAPAVAKAPPVQSLE